MSDRKAVIKNADMSEDMQSDAVDCATQALEKYNIEKVCLCGLCSFQRNLLARVPHTDPCSHGSCPSLNNRTLRRTSRRNSTKSTTQHGTASWVATLDRTSHTRQSTSSTSISARSPSFCSNRADLGISYSTCKHYTTLHHIHPSIHHRIVSLMGHCKRQVKAHSHVHQCMLSECASWPCRSSVHIAVLDAKPRRSAKII